MSEKEENNPKTSNLIPLKDTDNSHIQAKRGKKGGLVKSSRKKMAARLRELKKAGANNPTIKRIVDIMEDPACSALDIKILLDKIQGKEWQKKDKVNVQNLINLANAYIKFHKAHHGDRSISIHGHMGEIKVNIIREDLKDKKKED